MAEACGLLSRWRVLDGADCPVTSIRDLDLVVWRDPVGLLALSRAANSPLGGYRLRFSDQLIVDLDPVDRGARLIRRSAGVPQATCDHFILDQLLPRLLADEGHLVLHGALVQLSGKTVLILGETGQGKSTLAASLAQAGATLLGDDAAIVAWSNGEAVTRAVYPSLRLLPDSIDALFPEPPATRDMAHYSSKRRVDVPLGRAEGAATALEAMFVLQPLVRSAEITIARLPAAEACLQIISNSFALDPADAGRARQRLADASRLANAVPAFGLSYPRDYACLTAVRGAMIEQLGNRR